MIKYRQSKGHHYLEFINQQRLTKVIYQNNKRLIGFIMEKISSEKLFKHQNIVFRKKLRERDLEIASRLSLNLDQNLNLLMVGPHNSGKTSLAQLLYFALNAKKQLTSVPTKQQNIQFDKHLIKQNTRSQIRGLGTITQTQPKLGITAYQINHSNPNNPNIKYRKALQLLGVAQLNCVGCFPSDYQAQKIIFSHVLVCLSMAQKIPREQLTGLKLFIEELQERRIKFKIIGTKYDKVNECKKLGWNQYVEQWKKQISRVLKVKETNSIYCMSNRIESGSEQMEQISFYALRLLNQVMEVNKRKELKRSKSNGVLCFLPFVNC